LKDILVAANINVFLVDLLVTLAKLESIWCSNHEMLRTPSYKESMV